MATDPWTFCALRDCDGHVFFSLFSCFPSPFPVLFVPFVLRDDLLDRCRLGMDHFLLFDPTYSLCLDTLVFVYCAPFFLAFTSLTLLCHA